MKVLSWPGAKWSMSSNIIELMPEHKIYIEPFFGSGAVFFNKTPSKNEIINDLDGEVVNLFRVIRNYAEELSNLICFTPYSREEYDNHFADDDPVERARMFLVRSNMARASMQSYSSGWRHAGLLMSLKSKKHVLRLWNNLPQQILKAAIRLKDAEIENINAIELIKKYNHKDVLLYIDPPYLLSTRKQRYYNVEMTGEEEHSSLIDVLKKHKGSVMISGYESKLYNRALADWTKHEFVSIAEAGKKRTEIVWTNYSQYEQISMLKLMEVQ